MPRARGRARWVRDDAWRPFSAGYASLVRLPKPLRNGIVRAVEAGGLDASECTFYYGDEESRLTHLPSGSYFFVKGGPADSTATTVVGDGPPETSEPFTWVILDDRVRDWAEEVKRDVDTPDLSQGLDPFERVIGRARNVLAASEFASAYPGAFDAWAAAERLLWKGDSGSNLTTIGHNVREAMQAFATAMVDAFGDLSSAALSKRGAVPTAVKPGMLSRCWALLSWRSHQP
jgi:hypothetical protein